jgi:2-iminobutanoate/2-iminopropanoate deaminase
MAGVPISKFREANRFVYTSGQVYLTPEGKLLEGTIEEKVHQVMKNLEGILKDAETSFAKVLKTTIYVTEMANYGKVNEVYATYFIEHYPTREVVCVKELPLGAEVEISMVASK